MELVRRHVVLAVALCLTAAAAGEREAVRSLWQQGASLYQSGDLQGAIDRWQEALALDPNNTAIADKIARAQTELAATQGNPPPDEVAWPLNPYTYTELQTWPLAYMSSGRTMIPFRALLEWMGAEVDYERGTIIASMPGGGAVELVVGGQQARVNGNAVQLDVAPVVRSGTTFVPLRFVSESLGADVRWNGPESTVLLHHNARFAQVFVASPAVLASLPAARRPQPAHWPARRPSAYWPGAGTTQPAAGTAGGGGGAVGEAPDAGRVDECPQGGAHVAGDYEGQRRCRKCGRFMR